jgi:hypothetical protein
LLCLRLDRHLADAQDAVTHLAASEDRLTWSADAFNGNLYAGPHHDH